MDVARLWGSQRQATSVEMAVRISASYIKELQIEREDTPVLARCPLGVAALSVEPFVKLCQVFVRQH